MVPVLKTEPRLKLLYTGWRSSSRGSDSIIPVIPGGRVVYALAAHAAAGIWISTQGRLHNLNQKSDGPNGDVTGGQRCNMGRLSHREPKTASKRENRGEQA